MAHCGSLTNVNEDVKRKPGVNDSSSILCQSSTVTHSTSDQSISTRGSNEKVSISSERVRDNSFARCNEGKLSDDSGNTCCKTDQPPHWSECLKRSMPILIKKLIVGVRLRGCMEEREVFISSTIKRCWGFTQVQERRKEILKLIKIGNGDCFNRFCEALCDSGQEHLVNKYLRTLYDGSDVTDAIPAVHPDDETLLSFEIKELLRKNRTTILDILNSNDEFLCILVSDDVFIDFGVESIAELEIEEDRNSAILDLLLKSSLGAFNRFLAALSKTKQHTLVRLLRPEAQRREASLQEQCRKALLRTPVTETCHRVPGASPQACDPEQVIDKQRPQQFSENEGEYGKPVDAPVHELEQGLNRVGFQSGREGERGIKACSQGQNSKPGEQDSPDDEISYNEGDCSIKYIERFPSSEKLREVAGFIDRDLAYPCHLDGTIQGRALVIANERFNVLANRLGTKVDVNNLKNLLKYLNFDYVVRWNLEAAEMIEACETERNKLESSHTVFVCFILSHGEDGIVHGNDGKHVKLEELTAIFDGINCPDFRDKPKIFMIQACQGGLTTEGVPSGTDQADAARDRVDTEFKQIAKKHAKADIAVILASYPGYVAWRNEDRGSYFVQCVVDVFFKYAHEMHFSDMITMVTRRLNKCVMNDKFKQTPLHKTTLEKMIYLLPVTSKK